MLTFTMIIDTPEEKSLFRQLYNDHHEQAYMSAHSVLKEYHLALDAVQTTYMNIAKNFSLIQKVKKENHRKYISDATRNVAINMLREEIKGRVSYEQVPGYVPMDEGKLLEDAIINANDCERLLDKLNDINPDYSEIIYLRFTEELTYKEIGIYLGITTQNAKVRCGRALKAVKKIAEKEAK